ncbi:AvaB protein [Beauveria brongniartii RCEF 3172]|uniref:AvaB protein n=1 Tax=Beauveria brongniartii RCEF 3172 TaxID=1081107 RepID=A0A167IIK2_9HYPO|nr:AvaB protein [Beauveria brongniartii RCEF 3172]
MSACRSLHFSDGFVISCGTVTVDIAESRVLLIRSRGTGEYYLPKGRKDVHESLEDAALRETWEETGVRAQLLPVCITTRATPSAAAGAAGADPASCVTEPMAVAQRVTDGVLKIIFWFVAAADSAAAPEEGMQQEGEDFEALWVGWDKVRSTLTFEDDWRIAEAGITAATATN